jgi:hypothetical protein
MLSLILIFATISGLAAHYSFFCMAATSEESRRLTARKEDGA